MKVNGASQTGKLLIGNKAPERKKTGNNRKLMMNWKPSGLSIIDPIISPKLVNDAVVKSRITKDNMKETKVMCRPGISPIAPKITPSIKSKIDWMSESVAPPATLPKNIVVREIGATKTSFKKSIFLSQTI